MTSSELTTTLQDRRIYAALINLNNRGYPRTQKQVAARLGLAPSSVSDSVRKLVKMEMIAVADGFTPTAINRLYRPGKTHAVIEEYIRIDNTYYGRQMDAYGQGITPPETAIPHVPVSRVHLNGGWIWYDVKDAGILGTISSFDKSFKLRLFPNLTPTETRGGTQHYRSSVVLNGATYSVHYICSQKGVMRMGISPPDLIMTAEQVANSKDHVDAFADQVAPLLRALERYGGWSFVKDDLGNYAYDAKAKVEYALDGTLSNAIKDVAPEMGIPGVTPLWTDDSPKSLGDSGEVESNLPDLVHTLMTANKLAARVNNLSDDNLQLKNRFNEFCVTMDFTLGRIMEDQECLATLLANQSKLAVMSEKMHNHNEQHFVPVDGGSESDGGMYR